MTKLAAFLSYAHRDDKHHGGAITQLSVALSGAIGVAIGDDFEIFQDRKDIAWGHHWPSKLEHGLAGSRFLIAILSPSFFNSEYCRKELTEFLAIEQAAGRNDLILPIYYVPSPLIENPLKRDMDPLAKAIAQRQYADWRDLRHLPFTEPKVRRKLDSLAQDLVKALEKSETDLPAPSNRIFETPFEHQDNVSGLREGDENAADLVDDFRQRGLMEQPVPFSVQPSNSLPEPGTVFRDIDEPWCPEMVVIPEGSFVMGSPPDEEWHNPSEKPEHWVRFARPFTRPFALGIHPVTFDEFEHYCIEVGRQKPGDHGWGRGRRPVINVNVDDAEAYLNWLSKITGKYYRLPSEAEWEYACRAQTTTPFANGTTINTDQANYDGSDPYGDGKTGVYRKQTTAVGSFPPNPFGLYDMHGNVWEWCADHWHDNYDGAPVDGSAWLEAGDPDRRVLRGGSWLEFARHLRSACRFHHAPDERYNFIGFRCARVQE